MNLLKKLQKDTGITYLFIAHDLAVVKYLSSRIAVMYLGKIVEIADTKTLFENPKHPYTQELLRSIPTLSREKSSERLTAIEGSVPPPFYRPSGCMFHPRCPKAIRGTCDVIEPQPIEISTGHQASCLLYDETLEKAQVK